MDKRTYTHEQLSDQAGLTGLYGDPVRAGLPLPLAPAMGIRGKSRQELSELPPRKSLAKFGSKGFEYNGLRFCFG